MPASDPRAPTASTDGTGDPLEGWRRCRVRPFWPRQDEHALHCYFNLPPEHPDGRQVLVFASVRPDAQVGRLCIIDRITQEIRVLDHEVEVEDAHRQANQQWVCGGDYAVYMTCRNGDFEIRRVDPVTLRNERLCSGRQVFWSQPGLDEVPLYGPHWQPGQHRDLELLDVRTGRIRTAVALEQVLADHAGCVREIFHGDRPDSIAFPILSPDGSRVFFKLSKVRDGGFRSEKASSREGLFVYDVKTGRSIGFYASWGHPAWMPDSRHILRKSFLIDTNTMQTRTIPWYPEHPNSHSSPSPDGRLLAMDIARDEFTARDLHWSVVVGDYASGWHRIHTDPAERHGTTSWRPAHPHPVFSTDGRRIYFNANQGTWTTLHVAERDD